MNPLAPVLPAPWHVLGAGAIGGLWALRLSARHFPVILIGRSALPSRLLRLQDGDTEREQSFPQVTAGATGPVQHLLVATKCQDTREALAPLLPEIVPAATVVLLQNGMGVEDWLQASRPDVHVLVAITTDGVFRPAPGTLVLAGRGDTWLGPLAPEDGALAATVAADLGMAFASDIRERRWLKLAMNCAINPLTALRRCRNGELLTDAGALADMRATCDEVAQVMRAEGLAADSDTLFRLACETATRTAANLSSMRVDVEAGRPTEIDFLNGFVAARGRAHGIATPANDRLLAAIHGLD